MIDLLERIPPHNIEAERAVLGAMMLDNDAAVLALDVLKVDDFYIGKHKRIFRAITKVINSQDSVDILLINDRLESAGDLEAAGGAMYVHELLGKVPSAANIEIYADQVREKSIRRAIIKQSSKLIQHAHNGLDIDELMALVGDASSGLSEHATQGGFHEPHDAIQTVLDEIENGVTRGLSTGFLDLDKLTRGLQPGSFNILAGLPSQGKSTLALNIALNAAANKAAIGIVQLEGTEEEYARRAIACLARMDLMPGDDNVHTESDIKDFLDAAQEFGNMPIWIDAGPNQTIDSIRSRSRMAIKAHNLKLIVVDYLQLIMVPRKETIFEQVSAVSIGLKNLAKEFGVPILALCQFNREAAKEKRPRISQLRGSGQLEQDADTILILHDKIGYLDKNRNGPQGMFNLAYFPEQFRFENCAGERQW